MRRGDPKRRHRVAQEAARLMYEEDVREYFRAKHLAVKRLFGRDARREGTLPSNGEIQTALLHHAELAEGESRTRRLAAMRLLALQTMSELEEFSPRLIGSVSTGHIRHGSDIDIQLFGDDIDSVRYRLHDLGWPCEEKLVSFVKYGEYREYQHFYVEDLVTIEMTLYPYRELRFTPRSSTNGQPIVRLKSSDLRSLIEREHFDDLRDCLNGGQPLTPSDFDTPLPTAFQGLLTQ